MGGFEGAGAIGEGPCSLDTFTCANARTELNAPCPSDSFLSGLPCEFSDAFCMPKGPRSITINGVPSTVRWPVAGCEQNVFQNGDLDFDGSSYVSDWPDGSPNHPSTFEYVGPFDASGHLYPRIQFETNVAASEMSCDFATGAGCTAVPRGAAFYPFWTLGNGDQLASTKFNCQWNFGNVIAGSTIQSFGGTAEYGTPNLARFPGTVISPILPNPQLSAKCAEGADVTK
jgi:hypothetical protein